MNKLLIVLATLPLAAGIAFASPQQDSSMQSNSMHDCMMHRNGMMHMPDFNKLDENHDGKISRSEYQAFTQRHMRHDDSMGHKNGMSRGDNMSHSGAR